MTKKHEGAMLTLLVAAGMVCVLLLAALMTGLLPASSEEREFIDMAKRSSLARTDPRLAAAIKVTDDAVYVSKGHFQIIANAVNPAF